MDICSVIKFYRGEAFSGYTEGYVEDEFAAKADYVIGIPDVIAQFVPKK